MPAFIKSRLFRAYRKIEVREHKLLYLFLEITRSCNLSCRHCGSDCTADAAAPELTADSWLHIIEYIAGAFGAQVVFVITGGEPLLHPELERIGSRIKGLGMRWGMVTNGYALDAARLDRLLQAGPTPFSWDAVGRMTGKERLS